MNSADYFRFQADRLRKLLPFINDGPTRMVLQEMVAEYEVKAALAAQAAEPDAGPPSSNDAPMAQQVA